ncbi:MAG TPA: iron ABC transporter permease [Phototrophicaceae bacterium]|nr:iron ABC transporter permease [Phototrophicaceae bacterium]
MNQTPIASTTEIPHTSSRSPLLIVLLILLIAVFLLSLALGSVAIPLDQIVRVLLGGSASRDSWTQIVLQFRLPKALTGMLAGAALGIGGLQMQTLFRNPLADPYVLGISSGASLGVALIVLSVGTPGVMLLAGVSLFSDLGIALAASLGSALVLALVLLVARRVESSVTLLILGLMFGYGVSAVVSLLLYFSIAQRIQAYVNWTFGSFGAVTWDQMQVFAPAILIGLAIAFLLSKSLNALLLGETYARSMGMNVRRVRRWIIVSTALLAGAVTAFCGPIGFLGIAVPHLCRSLFNTSDHRILIPATILMGGIVAMIADILTQLPGTQLVLPLNAITALIGAPVVIWIILRSRGLKAA